MRDRPDALMLFAAGFGTRMHPLSLERPKPLIEVAGMSLLDHALALAEGLDLPTRLGNVHYLADQMAGALNARGIAVSHEAPDILDTGGGLKAALPLLGAGPVVTLNTDAVWTGPSPIARILSAWDADRMDALLCIVCPEHAEGYTGAGDFAISANGQLRRAADHIYAGLQIIKPGPVAAFPGRVFSMNRVWDELIARGRLYGLVHRGRWCDVGQPESIPLAEAMLAESAGV